MAGRPWRRVAKGARLISTKPVDSQRSMPLVSIGLPTYNGAGHLRDALDSLLAQDYPNLELLVSDNASTDETPTITTEYAQRDPRVRVVRQQSNIGPTANFTYVLRESHGAFFMWAADDDRWDRDYVSACLAALEANPRAVMAASSVQFIEGEDEHPAASHVPELFDNPDLSSPDPAVRIARLLSRAGWYLVYGLIRRSAADAIRPIAPAYGWDVIVMAELATRGPIVVVPRALFTYRVVRRPVDTDRGAWSQEVIGLTDIRATPYSHLQEACCAAVAAGDLGWWQRLRTHAAVLLTCYVRPTPMRKRIDAEVATRFRLGVGRSDVSDVLKYGALRIFVPLRRRLERRRVAGR